MAPPAGRDRPATIVSPSILAADFAKLAEEAARIRELGADWLHIDVMVRFFGGCFFGWLRACEGVFDAKRRHICCSAISCTSSYLDRSGCCPLTAARRRRAAKRAPLPHKTKQKKDGHFVPNLTIGAPVLKSLKAHAPDAVMDVHLMVSEPAKWIKGECARVV